MAKYSVAGSQVINDNGNISYATSIIGGPTLYRSVTTTSINSTSGFNMTKIEVSGSSIRAVANNNAVG